MIGSFHKLDGMFPKVLHVTNKKIPQSGHHWIQSVTPQKIYSGACMLMRELLTQGMEELRSPRSRWYWVAAMIFPSMTYFHGCHINLGIVIPVTAFALMANGTGRPWIRAARARQSLMKGWSIMCISTGNPGANSIPNILKEKADGARPRRVGLPELCLVLVDLESWIPILSK